MSFINTVLTKFKMNQIGTGIRLFRIFAGTAWNFPIEQNVDSVEKKTPPPHTHTSKPQQIHHS